MLVAFAFEGGANGVAAAAGGARAYADAICCAVALAVVVNAVLYTAGNTVDMLGDTLIVISVLHDVHSFPSRILRTVSVFPKGGILCRCS